MTLSEGVWQVLIFNDIFNLMMGRRGSECILFLFARSSKKGAKNKAVN